MQTVVMPKLGDTMEEGKILRWLKQEGDVVKKGDALAEIETEKVNIEVESFFAGTLRKILVPAGTSMAVGAPIALVGAATEAVPAATTAGAVPATPVAAAVTETTDRNGYSGGTVATEEPTERIFISPIARHIASEHNVDITHIQGTGPGGRIIRADVEAMMVGHADGQQERLRAAAIAAAAEEEQFQAVPLTQMRKTIARRLQQSMQTAPHFYVTMTIDATRLSQLREAVNEYAATLTPPVKVSFNDLIVKAAAMVLTKRPEVNVSLDGERLLFKNQIHIGIAVALPAGLIVPVIHDADRRGVLDIARESQRLVEAARASRLKLEDLSGGTFSVSNLGMYGVDEFTAIINPPESAILAVGAIIPSPVVDAGQVVVREQMKVTLSADHRALDGAVAAGFLQDLKHLLEQPLGMLL
ncbi:MAG: dihydrolipoamide acetyltransferase [Chloroflexi bacterium]|nr:MAG: dihydrolipoamide acetyltransferase [Chloroflexota bacterium]